MQEIELSNAPSDSRRRAILIGCIALAIAVGLVVAFKVLRAKRTTMRPEDYPRVVADFYIGVMALEVDDHPRAKEHLTLVTQLAPEEPAGWANLGLYHLREGAFDAAAQQLDHAHALAPQSSAIEVLYGLLESRRGDFDKAVAHFQKAVELNPEDVRARFALAVTLERRGGDQALGQIVPQYEQMVRLKPKNLAILLDAARLRAKQGDAPGVREILKSITALSSLWPANALAPLKGVSTAAAAENVRPAATAILFLRNALLPWPPFQRDMAEITTSDIKVGEPIERFMKLASPSAEPAAADLAVGLASTPLPIGGSGWSCIAAAWLKSDGPPALFVANGREVRRADGQGTALAFPGSAASVPPGADGVLAVDWRNRYSTGLVLAGAGGVRLMEPEEGGGFTNVTAKAIADAAIWDADYFGAWAADFDLDGDLDIVLAPRKGSPIVLRNNADGTFKVVRPFEGVSELRQFVWADLDGDGVPDAVMLDEKGAVWIFANDRGGTFHQRHVTGDLHAVQAIAAGDLTRRGRSDLVALRADGSLVRAFDDNDGTADLKVQVVGATTTGKPTRLAIADVDDNGSLDLIVGNDAATTVFLAAGNNTYAPAGAAIAARVVGSIPDPAEPNGLRFLALGAAGEPMSIAPRGTRGYHYQIVRPRANATGLQEHTGGQNKINTFGIGGELELRSSLLYQSRLISGGAVHFGTGTNGGADVLRILWPNGNVQAEFDLKADAAMTADQRLKGSCPMLFAYDGKQMGFVTDLIWRSPLGLRINAQDTAAVMQTEDWVKIRGDQLAMRDGYYDLRVTAELWETHFFDHISLMTVDHPAGTEVFVDERFAVPPPPLKAYLTTPTTPFANAVDEHGNDVSEVVRLRDGKYLDSFQRGEYQGVAADHWVELTIGDGVDSGGRLALIGSGWIHPTDSSINVAIAQGAHTAPAGLSIEVPDGDGGWKVARAGLGFPAGKNKTVVIPLDGILKPGGPRKLRLRTNLEVYWDSLASAELLDEAGIQSTRTTAQRADLRYRGFSRIEAADAHSPELPYYDQLVGAAPRWLDLTGFYTRYGDVRELLEKTDDRYVIMNAGDEMQLRFMPGKPAAEGRIRDFILIADGWVKDGDFNTAFSKTILPLPRHDWPTYDSSSGDLQSDPAYQRHPEDWLNFHTRYVTPDGFHGAMRPNK